MQGRGVTNFSVDKPSHQYTTRTTEFDDALIQRGIVTVEQAMMAKGASEEEAMRLAEEKRRETSASEDFSPTMSQPANDDEDSFDDDDDDEFLKRYRKERLQELKTLKASATASSQTKVRHISRNEWTQAVNEASMENWVIVTMVEPSGDRKDRVVQELHAVGREFLEWTGRRDASSRQINLVTIDAAQAIPNWPAERVPVLFAYRDGIKQHEWIAQTRGEFPSRAHLEDLFRQWSVI